MNDVRCDRIARPNYAALPERVRAEIESAIPEGAHLTIVSRHGRDYHARILRDGVQLSESLLCSYVEVACWQALRRAAA
jgi:hypothetical protein